MYSRKCRLILQLIALMGATVVAAVPAHAFFIAADDPLAVRGMTLSLQASEEAALGMVSDYPANLVAGADARATGSFASFDPTSRNLGGGHEAGLGAHGGGFHFDRQNNNPPATLPYDPGGDLPLPAPEPATLGLFGLGLGMVGMIARRKRG